MKTMQIFATSLVLAALPLFGFSQNFWEIGAAPGVMVYYGDLTVPDVTLRETHIGAQISAKRYYHGEHAIRFNAVFGTISGDDNNYESHKARGNSFKGTLLEFSAMGEIDLKGRKRFSRKMGYQRTGSPYIMFGLSGIYCNPDVAYGQPDSKDKDIDYPNWHLGMPFGAGYKFDLNEHLVIGAELGIRLTLSDYLDGTQASGNSYKNDAFIFLGLTAAYRFEKKTIPAAKA
jgi:hypothetical protein